MINTSLGFHWGRGRKGYSPLQIGFDHDVLLNITKHWDATDFGAFSYEVGGSVTWEATASRRMYDCKKVWQSNLPPNTGNSRMDTSPYAFSCCKLLCTPKNDGLLGFIQGCLIMKLWPVGFEHPYDAANFGHPLVSGQPIWRFPSMGVPQKWMVYNGKSH